MTHVKKVGDNAWDQRVGKFVLSKIQEASTMDNAYTGVSGVPISLATALSLPSDLPASANLLVDADEQFWRYRAHSLPCRESHS